MRQVKHIRHSNDVATSETLADRKTMSTSQSRKNEQHSCCFHLLACISCNITVAMYKNRKRPSFFPRP